MKSYSPALAAYMASARQTGTVLRYLVWIEARNRTTGATEALGVWSGGYDLAITIDGQARTYLGLGGLIELPQVVYAAGVHVQELTLRLSGNLPGIRAHVLAYDLTKAPVTLHRIALDPATRAQVGDPVLRFKGEVDGLDIPRVAPGQNDVLTLTCLPAAQALTRPLAQTKSDAVQSRRMLPDGITPDRIRRYAHLRRTGVWWGENAPKDSGGSSASSSVSYAVEVDHAD